MAWLEITISTAASDIEDTAAILTAAGFSDLVMEDQAEFESFLQENKAYWDYIDEDFQKRLQGLSRIRLYLESGDAASLTRLKSLCQDQNLPVSVRPLPDTDWEECWKVNYPPQPVGKNLVVLPYWLSGASDGRIPVILDPGLTFGTGAHPSTQMVMEAMEALAVPGMRCLDLGSGSGILSITALRLGAQSAVGVDIDPKAEDIARENAAYNGYAAPEFTALTGDVLADAALMERLSSGTYDLVLVNIVADVIIRLAPVLPRFLRSGSFLICSGILNTRLSDVTAALEDAGLQIRSHSSREDWCCVTAQRRY